MNIRILTILIIIIISCKKENQQSFVIKQFNHQYLIDSTNSPPQLYYTDNNIILVDSLSGYFYHDNYNSCGTGWTINNPPMPINFSKKKLEHFETIDEILEKVSESQKNNKLVMLVHNKDTICDHRYFELKDSIKSIEKTYLTTTRKVTNDEIIAISNDYIIDCGNYFNIKVSEIDILNCILNKLENLQFGKFEANLFFEIDQESHINNVEFTEVYNEAVFKIAKFYPNHLIWIMNKENGIMQNIILEELKFPINDEFDLQNLILNFEQVNKTSLVDRILNSLNVAKRRSK